MGLSVYIIKLEAAQLEGNVEFCELLEKHFTNDNNEVYIETQTWEDLINDHPEIEEKFPLEVKDLKKDLENNGGAISYSFLW